MHPTEELLALDTPLAQLLRAGTLSPADAASLDVLRDALNAGGY